MLHVGNAKFWFDNQVGTYSAEVNGVVYGSRSMQYPTVEELQAACGVSLSVDEAAELRNEFDSIPVDEQPCRISKLDFDELFTDTEWERINTASVNSTPLKRMLEKRKLADFICKLSLKTILGVRQLEQLGLLDGPGRANQILGVTQ